MTDPVSAATAPASNGGIGPSAGLIAYAGGQRYDELFPDSRQRAQNCLTIVNEYARQPVRSVLDIGCGTGYALDSFARSVDELWGVDAQQEMVVASKARCPQAVVRTADMRTLELGRSFDVVICLGSTFIHAITNADIAASLQTMANHTTPGGLLVLEMLSGPAVLTGAVTAQNLNIGTEDGPLHGVSTIELDLTRSQLHLTRNWYSHGQPKATEQTVYRLLMPAEIEAWLHWAGFQLIAVSDNVNLTTSDLRGQRLWIVARRNECQVFEADAEPERSRAASGPV